MKLYLGVTDNNWFRYLSQIGPEDVNFWQPNGNVTFKVLSPGAPFLFKLKKPLNAIGGVGFFSSHTTLPISIAWDTFRNRNGCATFDEFSRMILNYRSNKHNINPTIGCIVLTNPVFFREEDWIETPPNWANSIVQGKSYSTDEPIGNAIWKRIEALANRYMAEAQLPSNSFLTEEPAFPSYGNPILTKVRLGQGAFRACWEITFGIRSEFSVT